MISAPLLLVGGLLVGAVIVYFVRRVTLVAALLSASIAAGYAWLVTAVPSTADEAILGGWLSGGEHVILGRTLAISTPDRVVLAAAGLAVAVLVLVAGCLPGSSPVPGSRPARPGDIFFPGVLVFLGVATAALVIETLAFSVLLLEIAAGVITALLQGTRFGSTRGAWRFFLFTSLAMPLLLTAAWLIDTQVANPRQTELLNPAVLLLTLGFAIYLSAVPFHLWAAPATEETSPLVGVIVMGLFQWVALSLVAGAFESFPWFANSPVPYQWFSFLGSITVGLGAILAFSSGSFGQLSAYSVLVDTGGLLLLLGLREPIALQAAWLLALARTASVTMYATGLAIIRSQAGSDRLPAATGLGWSQPLAAAVLLLGGLSLAGFPFTPGFAARWTAVRTIADGSVGRAALLLAGSGSVVFGVLRVARTLFAARSSSDSLPPAARLNWLTYAILAVLVVGAIIFSVYPNFLLSTAVQISSSFSFLR